MRTIQSREEEFVLAEDQSVNPRFAADNCLDSGEGTRVLVAKSEEEVEVIRSVWNTWLWNPNADIDFYLQVLRSKTEIIRPHVLVLYRDSVPVAMLVGRIVQSEVEARVGYLRLFKRLARSLTFVYGGQAGDLSPENSKLLIAEVVRSLRDGEADLAEFRFVRVDSPLCEAIAKIPGLLMRDRRPQEQPHWAMSLPESADAVTGRMSSHDKRQIRRRMKQLETDYCGNVRIVCFESSNDIDALCASIEVVAKKTYQRALGVGFFDTPETRDRLRFEAERGWLRAHVMFVADNPCAFWMGTVCNNTFYSGDVGYDPAYKKYELGKHLLVRVLEDLCREGARRADFGLGDADWKHRFGDQEWYEALVSIYAPTLKGLTLSASRSSTIFLHDLAKRALEKGGVLNRIKRFWRGHAKKADTAAE